MNQLLPVFFKFLDLERYDMICVKKNTLMVSYIEKEKYTAPVLQRKSKSYHNFLNRLHRNPQKVV